ncbi:nuclear pore complex subunit [Extremus antarcticus]|uniref:Nuclear pore complex subunit n=1 Tax=Extremus antarcticus TaxID=702011 RepID=A0AAJ0G9D8_9PEZI|nr:nuclear pore complex subunit [Extremus antarcticus]
MSLFGGNPTAGPAASAAPANASVFGNGLLLHQQNQQPTHIGPNGAAPQPAYFDALLQRGKKRQTEERVGALGDLPQLQLGLQDISRKVRNLGQGGPSAGLARSGNARGHYLLSASGVNTGQALRDLTDLATTNTTTTQGATEALAAIDPTGVKQTLAQQHQNDFQKMVDSHVQKAQDDFNKMIDEKLHGVDWDAHRQRIYEHFGLKKPQESQDPLASTNGMASNASFGKSSRFRSRYGASTANNAFDVNMTRSIIGTPGPNGVRKSVFGDVAEKMPVEGMRPAPEERGMRMKQEKYIERVKELNVARLQEKAYPLLHKFSEVEGEPSNDDTSMLVHAYKALMKITGEDASIENLSDPAAVKERQYATAYLDENATSASASRVRKRIIDGSRKFLEGLFYTQLEATVTRSPKEANIGGIPTALAKVKGYVRVRASRKELGPELEKLQSLNGDYCWPIIFYLLRSGLYQEALDYLEENTAAFRQIDRSFVRYLRAFVNGDEHRLPPDMQTAINNEYSARTRLAPEDSIDPYRMVCYKVLGRCELPKRNLDGITNDTMDWIWLQFALAREYHRVDEFAHEAFGLEELRQSIKDIGERYFGPSSDVANAPTTLFFMQILAGMFEKAVADLYPHSYVSAVHFAIALDFYGLLRVADVSNSEDLLSETSRQQPQIAFGSMVGLYTRDFRTADATAAVDYLTLICLNGDLTGDLGKRQRELCYQALNETILETREFAQLLGDVRSDGQRIKGAVEQRLKLIGLDNEREFLKNITMVAARTADEHSRVTDAALLFHLAEDYDKVIQVVCEAVSRALTTELGDQPARLTPLKPRNESQDPQQKSQPSSEPQGSLSLTSVDDPIELAQGMLDLYKSTPMYYAKIREPTSDACSILLQLASARSALSSADWAATIDYITASRLLPTRTGGALSAIRAHAQAFHQLPPVVARTVGHAMLWTVIACANNVERLKQADFEMQNSGEVIGRCVQTAKDVMVFAGLIRFKLPARVWDGLVRAGGELGAY